MAMVAQSKSPSMPAKKRSSGAAPPYGFQRDENGGLRHDPKCAPIRTLIFELFRASWNQTEVAKKLNAMGHRTRTGAEWTGVQVRRALDCPSAIGRYVTNKTTRDSSGKQIDRPESQWTVIDCPPLVSQETWDAVQAFLQSGDSLPIHTERATHTFTGLIRCACGGKMQIASPSTDYRCPNCKAKFPAAELERMFSDDLEDYLLTDPDVDESQVACIAARWPTFSQEQRRSIAVDTLDSLTVDKSNAHFIYLFPQSIKDGGDTRQMVSSTNQDPTNAPVAGEPLYIRLPKPGTRCDHTGLSRSKLYELITPTKENSWRAPVESISDKKPGQTRGTRLIVFASLKSHLNAQRY